MMAFVLHAKLGLRTSATVNCYHSDDTDLSDESGLHLGVCDANSMPEDSPEVEVLKLR